MAPRIEADRLRSLLIVKMSSIGDVVHALPVATALRRRYPQLRISWAVEEWAAPLLADHPAIDRVIVFPPMRWGNLGEAWTRALARAVRALTSEAYDVCLDLQGLAKSSLLALLSRAPLRLGTWDQREGAGFVSQSVPSRRERLHVVDDYLQCAVFLGAAADPVAFDLLVPEQAATAIAQKLWGMHIRLEVPLIVINPSASVAWKTWKVDAWARVVGALADAGEVLLVGSHDQVARHAEVARLASRRPHDLTGQTTLAELIALLDRCAVHIAPDTGSAHIAAALGRPVVGLYGPTPPWRKAPYGYQDLVVSHDDCCGSGCPRFCLSHRRCLQIATPNELIARVQRTLMCAPRVSTSGPRRGAEPTGPAPTPPGLRE
jgi:lipopolysaccharide heptosyltransferase I